ncbi:MAG: hypothetical protein ACO4CT_06995 [Planctomycetota bacterium]|jgi:hypothetical protein
MNAFSSAALDVVVDGPVGPANSPFVLLGVAVFGFTVVMWVWVRRRSSRGDGDS